MEACYELALFPRTPFPSYACRLPPLLLTSKPSRKCSLILPLECYSQVYSPLNTWERRIHPPKSPSLPQASRIRPSSKNQHSWPREIPDCPVAPHRFRQLPIKTFNKSIIFTLHPLRRRWKTCTHKPPQSLSIPPVLPELRILLLDNLILLPLTAHRLNLKIASLRPEEWQAELRIPLPSLHILPHLRGKTYIIQPTSHPVRRPLPPRLPVWTTPLDHHAKVMIHDGVQQWLTFGCIFPLCKMRPAVEPNRQRATGLQQRCKTGQRHLRIHKREALRRSDKIGRLGGVVRCDGFAGGQCKRCSSGGGGCRETPASLVEAGLVVVAGDHVSETWGELGGDLAGAGADVVSDCERRGGGEGVRGMVVVHEGVEVGSLVGGAGGEVGVPVGLVGVFEFPEVGRVQVVCWGWRVWGRHRGLLRGC